MPAANSGARLVADRQGGWWFRRWVPERIAAGVTDRHIQPAQLLRRLGSSLAVVRAEQVHGASLAVVVSARNPEAMIAGCDALLTGLPGVALLIRSADCLPVFFADPSREVIGIAHAGWRGLAALLLPRVVAAFQRYYHAQASNLRVAIGPAIRSCCYEVGPEFAARFGPWVRQQAGRQTCDLIGVVRQQLRQCGVPPRHVVDSERCTACEPDRWFSLRREGPQTGRLVSLIALR